MNKFNLILLFAVVIGSWSCKEKVAKYELPVLGRTQIVEKIENGKVSYDTVQHQIANFAFTNQEGELVTNETLNGKVYVADFFFTSCPTICPVMKKEMLRVYEQFKDNPNVAIVSHTIDPEHDTVALLKDYADRLNVSSDTWHFLTGDKEEIYTLGESSYMVTAGEDDTAPGGYIHSGAFLLIDKKRRVRGVYDGTVAEQVDLMMEDIRRLLNEQDS